MGISNLGCTFDTVASAYEKFRPGYPAGLYQTIFNCIALDKSSSALEIGIGGGQATLPFLKTGCRLTAVEYGEQLSGLCREKFKEYPDFTVVAGKFEDVPFPDNAYDLIYSDHIAIKESVRKEFFSKIGDSIERRGGSITIFDTIDLQLAQKP